MPGPTTPWERLVKQAGQIEALGYDKLWLPDHFVNPEDREMDWFECWTSLAALATHTNTIRIGTLVSSMTLRNPALLARTALTVDHISGGRLELGVGAGGVPNCHLMTGVPQWERSERSARYQEFIEALECMLRQERTTYAGKFYNIQEAIMHPEFVSKPWPVFNIAGHGPKALRLAARYGDAWNTLSPGSGLTPEQHSDNTRQRCEKMCEFALQEGRDPETIGRTMLFGWTTDRLFGSLTEFYETIGRYRKAGIDDFCFIYVPGFEAYEGQAITSEEMLVKIAEEAIPALKNTI